MDRLHDKAYVQKSRARRVHVRFGTLYAHIGLENEALAAFQKSIELDPVSETNQYRYIGGYELLGRPDEAAALQLKLLNRPSSLEQMIERGDIANARKMLDQQVAANPTAPMTVGQSALLLALEGRFAEAEAHAPRIRSLARNRNYHHAAYDLARVYALQGKAAPAVEWLRETANTGMPNYLLFSRDPKLAKVRGDVEVKRFMAEMAARWERVRREFGQPISP